MKKFSHKQTKIIGKIENGVLHFEGGYIPENYIIEGGDWEEYKEPTSCFSETISVKRSKDGVTFTVGDTIKVDNEKATFNYTIKGFINHKVGDVCFTCITTKEKNGFGNELINIDIIKTIKNTGIMTKQCLSIQDYVDVLHDNKKAFLFEGTMVKLLKEKIKP